jgi:biotin carboxyl carrier protein
MHNTDNKLKVTFDGKEYIVDIRETGNGTLEVEVNGKTHQVSLENLTAGQMETPKAIEHIPAASTTPVPQPQTPSARASAPQTNLVCAPMPGDIVKISVKMGDTVSIGQELLVLEAMKMKNVIRSPQAGKVSAVEVSTGQSVKYGEPLIRFG